MATGDDESFENCGSEECVDPELLEQIKDCVDEDNLQFKKDVNSTMLNGLLEKTQERFNKWKFVPLNIAVTGNSGAGKSSFINAIRGIDDINDKYFAEVGVTETTKTVSKYPDPKNEKLVFWDLPGIGTPTFTKDNYKAKVGLENFDFFVILAEKRFTENDLLLVNILQKEKKSAFLFARTHIDQDISNHEKLLEKSMKNHVRTDNEKLNDKTAIIKKVRDDLVEKLKGCGIQDSCIFLIDNFETSLYDFGKMQKSLSENVSKKKQEAMVLSTSQLSYEVLDMKVIALKHRIPRLIKFCRWYVVTQIPFYVQAVRSFRLTHEVRLYHTQLGLTKSDMAKTANQLGMTDTDEMMRILGIKFQEIDFSTFKMMEHEGYVSSIIETLPILGTIILLTTDSWKEGAKKATDDLETYLDDLKENAKKIISAITEHAARKSGK